jgi:uncharacterized protein (DUF433 family)
MDKLLSAKYREGVDSGEQALYTPREAAYFLGVNTATLNTWFFGRHYRTKTNPNKPWEPVFIPADPELHLLSFNNLAEAHVLAATRYEHQVPFPAVRQAIAHLNQLRPETAMHPLLAADFLTNGALLFVEQVNELVNLTNEQLSLEIMKEFVVRVLRDEHGRPCKIYPLRENEPKDKVICITAGVSGSRPIIDGTRIPVEIILRRMRAGEDLEFIAEDYDLSLDVVKRVQIYGEFRAA